jgi:hypothetical protein
MQRKTFWLIVIAAGIIALIATVAMLVHIYFEEINAALEKFMFYFNHQHFLVQFLIAFALQLPFQILFFPGYSLFIVIFSYYLKNFLWLFVLMFVTVAIWTVLAYFLFKYLVKSLLSDYFKDEQLFQWLTKRSRESQWKVSVLIRSLMFSNIYKNVVLVLLKVDFWPFYIPAMIYYVFYIMTFAIVGESISTIREYYKGEVKSDDPKVKLMMILFPIVFVISVTILVTTFIYAYNEYQDYKKDLASLSLNLDMENNSGEPDQPEEHKQANDTIS